MSERLPYEEQLRERLNDLPLPNEDMAWADMKRRLEEDDDDGIIVWWRRGCMLWGLLLLILLVSGIWLVKKEKWFTKKESINKIENRRNTDDTDKTDKEDTTTIQQTNKSNTIQYPTTEKTTVSKEVKRENEEKGEEIERGNGVKEKKGDKMDRVNKKDNKRNSNNKKPAVVNPIKEKPVKKKDETVATDNVTLNQRDVTNPPDTIVPATVDSTITKQTKTDTSSKKPPIKENTLSNNEAKKDSSKKKQVTFSAGISMQQLLPLFGQKTVPYNSQGRKGTLADYIPSVYFRVNKENKWFVQGEFRYGAPQYTKEFVYKQQRKEDTLGGQTFSTRTTNTLKKTYYHQLPVTFNYYVKKDWSIGAGFMWNKFVSAISDQEVLRRNNSSTTDSIISKGIIRNKQDTSFKKSYFQAVFESQYKWKRFSFGARYTFGLEPYVRFTLLNGETGEDRNKSLQIFLRYELWKSKKKE